MQTADFKKILKRLERVVSQWDAPVVTLIARTGEGPFRVLISCLLSLRTKDETTAPAVQRLFAIADTPQGILKIPQKEIEKLIYPVGFYRVKARVLRQVSSDILSRFGGRVPDTMDDLLTLGGVGRKTANLVLSQGWKKEAICVDVHVHRITNRLGYVKTRNPDETEFALRRKLPVASWRVINQILVAFGQNHCRPVSPHCSTCPVAKDCSRVGVTHFR
jgi:endonuclease-3